MLTLNDGRPELWQWDTGRTLAVDADCSQVHFSNKVFGRSVDVDVVDGVAIIPDALLQTDKDLNVWAFVGTAENGYTKISKTFKVNRRNKPADYVFTPQEQILLKDAITIAETAKSSATAAVSSAAAAESSARAAAESEAGSKSHADNAASSASKAAQSEQSAASSASSANAAARAAASSKQAAAASETAAQEAAQQTATDKEAAEKSATRAESAAKIADAAATKVINEGVAEKLTEMQGIQEDVKARQQDVTAKQADVTANVELARQAALSNGYMQMGVDENGHLMYTRTTNLKDKIDFAIVNDTNLEVQIHG